MAGRCNGLSNRGCNEVATHRHTQPYSTVYKLPTGGHSDSTFTLKMHGNDFLQINTTNWYHNAFKLKTISFFNVIDLQSYIGKLAFD